jgi:hypothetical protein
MEQTLFIAAAFNLEIQGDARAGIEMRKGIYLLTRHICVDVSARSLDLALA